MDIREKMHSGKIYDPFDEEVFKEQTQRLSMLSAYNSTTPFEAEKRQNLLKEMFAELGDGCYIEPPFRANWGGKHVHFGKKVYANFNLTLVDDTHIYVGDYTMMAPNVILATATHHSHKKESTSQNCLQILPPHRNLRPKKLSVCTHVLIVLRPPRQFSATAALFSVKISHRDATRTCW